MSQTITVEVQTLVYHLIRVSSEETATQHEETASKCIKVTGLVLILSVSAMCPCVTVNQRAICTVTLTWVNCGAISVTI